MKTAINTRTQEEYDALMRYYDEKGIKWYENRKASSENYWPEYETAMCISFGIHLPEFISYANTIFYKKQGYTIIPYTEFAKANIEPDYKALYLEGRQLLERIAKWQLPETGKFWDEERTRPTSYEAEYGSNGVRDYWKNEAKQFLTNHKDGE